MSESQFLNTFLSLSLTEPQFLGLSTKSRGNMEASLFFKCLSKVVSFVLLPLRTRVVLFHVSDGIVQAR
jgi:hypothetical protein